jgi:hypothetical protein
MASSAARPAARPVSWSCLSLAAAGCLAASAARAARAHLPATPVPGRARARPARHSAARAPARRPISTSAPRPRPRPASHTGGSAPRRRLSVAVHGPGAHGDVRLRRVPRARCGAAARRGRGRRDRCGDAPERGPVRPVRRGRGLGPQARVVGRVRWDKHVAAHYGRALLLRLRDATAALLVSVDDDHITPAPVDAQPHGALSAGSGVVSGTESDGELPDNVCAPRIRNNSR